MIRATSSRRFPAGKSPPSPSPPSRSRAPPCSWQPASWGWPPQAGGRAGRDSSSFGSYHRAFPSLRYEGQMHHSLTRSPAIAALFFVFALSSALPASEFDIVIHEIHYNPLSGDDRDEFI